MRNESKREREHKMKVRRIKNFFFTLFVYCVMGVVIGAVIGIIYTKNINRAVELIRDEYDKQTILYIDPSEVDYHFVMLPETGTVAVEVERRD